MSTTSTSGTREMIHITCHVCYELGRERNAPLGSYFCDKCALTTQALIQEIQDLHEWISDPEYLANTREPASSYTKSRPPVSLHTVSLLDPRTKMRRAKDPVSAQRVLRAWVCAILETRGEAGWAPGDRSSEVGAYTSFLLERLQWILAQPAGIRFARHMACVANALRQEVGAQQTEEG
jgi:hypothetical protein